MEQKYVKGEIAAKPGSPDPIVMAFPAVALQSLDRALFQ